MRHSRVCSWSAGFQVTLSWASDQWIKSRRIAGQDTSWSCVLLVLVLCVLLQCCVEFGNMKFLVVAVVLVAAVSCASVGSVDLDKTFQEWKVTNGKVYSSPEEEAMRKQIWMDNWSEAEAHNARYAQGLETWTMGMTQFADMTGEEFESSMGTPHLDGKLRHLIAKLRKAFNSFIHSIHGN
ncbi:procathepsin L-like [Engraulis encrasicolus]|uniref:procathepsin L-like n=1 Tax=Engraulis encrasicolus TaxID=184585 RepID=UPI002FD366E7